MPDGGRDDGDADEEFQPGEEDAAPSGARTPADIGPDASVSGEENDGESAPLSDLREDVEQRREADDGDDFEELFTQMDAGDVDESSVWEQVSEPSASPSVGADSVATDATAADAERGGARDVRVVEKRLCHSCPHFADPPETACTHDGTTIDAEVDVDHFRVVDCPVVAEREDAEASDFSPDEP